MKRISCITYLRLLAMAIVFVRHALIASADAYHTQLTHPVQMFFVTPAWSGVWIFFIISGFLTGQTLLVQRKYALTMKGWISFIRQRAISLLIPVFCFIFAAQLLVSPEALFQPKVWLRFLTLTFNGGTGVGHGVGLVWYVFVLMWLYILSVPFCMVLNRLEKRSFVNGSFWRKCFICDILFGVLYRFFTGIVLKLDWYDFLYANPVTNVDLFFGGLLLSIAGRFPAPKFFSEKRLQTKQLVWLGAILLVVNCGISYYSEIGSSVASRLYRYVFPTITLLYVAAVLLDCIRKDGTERKLHPIIGFLDRQQFSFYLWHSVVLYCLSKRIDLGNPWLSHIALLAAGCVGTLAISCLFTNAVKPVINSLKTKYDSTKELIGA